MIMETCVQPNLYKKEIGLVRFIKFINLDERPLQGKSMCFYCADQISRLEFVKVAVSGVICQDFVFSTSVCHCLHSCSEDNNLNQPLSVSL